MRFLKFLLLAIFSLFFYACSEQEDLFQDEHELSIREVEDFINQQQSAKGRVAENFTIHYDLGIYRETSLGEALLFPVKPAKELYVSGSDSTKRFSVASTALTFAYKEGEEIFVDLVQPVPTDNQPEFTGYVLISSYGGPVKRVLYYENGIFTGEKNAGNLNGRSEGVDCETTHYYFCWDVSVGGEVVGEDCEYDGSSTTCDVTGDGSSGGFQPDDVIDAGPDSGGGGAGGTAPGEEANCIHPFNPELRVPCNENTCGEGFKPDGNGGCEAEGCGEGYYENEQGECVEDPDLNPDCASWEFVPVGPEGNYQACGVNGITFDYYNYYPLPDGGFYVGKVSYDMGLQFFEFPRVRDNGTFISAGEAAMINAIITGKVEKDMEAAFRNIPAPSGITLELAYRKFYRERLKSHGGRLTINSQYGNVPINDYNTVLFGNGNCN